MHNHNGFAVQGNTHFDIQNRVGYRWCPHGIGGSERDIRTNDAATKVIHSYWQQTLLWYM